MKIIMNLWRNFFLKQNNLTHLNSRLFRIIRRYSIKLLNICQGFSKRKIVLYYHKNYNFGDMLNEYLVAAISGREVIHYHEVFHFKKIYSAIGSILDEFWIINLVVWGSGLSSYDGEIRTLPREVKAVRGPLTRERLKNCGISVPEIYGDPGLLISYFYKPILSKTYDLGVIPHFKHKESDNMLSIIASNSIVNVVLIDVNLEPLSVVDLILSCKKIISSSLHGLIIADSYKIPNSWVTFEDSVVIPNFKFDDYYLGTNRKIKTPIIINSLTEVKNLYVNIQYDIFEWDSDKFIKACPFIKLNH
jgi:pyruvyltransferase